MGSDEKTPDISYDLEKAVEHIVHDYVYLVVAGSDTRKPLAPPLNHYAERTFLAHCRALAHFFSGGKKSRDMYARDFTSGPFARKLPVWDRWSGHIDKHLMHLSQARTTNTVPWTGEPDGSFLENSWRPGANLSRTSNRS